MFDEVMEKVFKLLIAMAIVIFTMFLMTATIKLARAEQYTCVVHKGEWVWIRESPSKDGRKVGRVRYGYEIESGDPENGYFKINVRPGWLMDGETATTGYVDASYFDRDVDERMYRIICEGPIAKRETPAGRLMCWIKPGSKISVLGWRYDSNGELWAKVFHGGYVKASFLGEI